MYIKEYTQGLQDKYINLTVELKDQIHKIYIKYIVTYF